jgi:uncharacterized protein YidB (DUF937 family)
MTALLGLIAIAGYQNRDKIAEMIRGVGTNQPQAVGQSNGELRGVLQNHAASGANVGELLNNGLRELVDRFKQNSRGDVAQSWINQGPNKEIGPNELKSAIGTDVLAELSQRTGLSEQELLTRLSQQLPSAIDKYTPEGRLPA